MREWARWLETAERHIGDDTINGKRVSTVFLGIDHNFSFSGPPLLFETMVFGDDGRGDEEEIERYATYEEAEEGHKRIVKKYGSQ